LLYFSGFRGERVKNRDKWAISLSNKSEIHCQSFEKTARTAVLSKELSTRPAFFFKENVAHIR
jgi:hypothetical protein